MVDTQKARMALVLGEDSRSFLSVIRSLGRANFSVHVVCYDRKSISLKSRYVNQAFFYNYQSNNSEEWIKNVLSLIERYQYDIIFPCDERAIYPLSQVKQQIPTTTKLAVANDEALTTLFDKWQTKKLAQKMNIFVANGKLIKLNEYNYIQLKGMFSEKFVIKPLQSFTASTLDKRNKVVIVRNEQNFIDFIQNNDLKSDYLIEEYFDGYGEGLSVFAWNGELKAVFSYKRLAEPYFGGGSSYRESNEIDPEQLAATKLLCKETKLSGLAMFEFRRNEKNKKWILVEVNARAWGGMPLAEFAGVDFPKLYVDKLCNPKADTSEYSSYRHVRARSLQTDLYEIKRESEIAAKTHNRFNGTVHLLKRISNITRILTSKESIDSLRIDDIAPFLHETKNIFTYLVNQATKNSILINNYQKWKTQKRIKKELSKKINRRVIFVCYGNIIRSPFAEHYFNQKTKKENIYIHTESFGFHKIESRNSPSMAVVAASDFNCNLNEHKSRCLYQLDINESDILFYFDHKNENIIHSYYATNNAYRLSDFLDDHFSKLQEIEDPYDTNVGSVKLCYEKIKNAIDNFIQIHKKVSQC